MVDLVSLITVLNYAQAVEDKVAVELEASLPDVARELLVAIELVAPLN